MAGEAFGDGDEMDFGIVDVLNGRLDLIVKLTGKIVDLIT